MQRRLRKEYNRLNAKHGTKDCVKLYLEAGVYNFYPRMQGQGCSVKAVRLAPVEEEKEEGRHKDHSPLLSCTLSTLKGGNLILSVLSDDRNNIVDRFRYSFDRFL